MTTEMNKEIARLRKEIQELEEMLGSGLGRLEEASVRGLLRRRRNALQNALYRQRASRIPEGLLR